MAVFWYNKVMPTDKSTIKSYNDYVEKWAQLRRSGDNFFHTYLEKPAMHKKIPSLKGKKVLCIGCGTGEECYYLNSLGAKKVIGIDIAKNLIKYAKESYPGLEFQVMDMEKMKFSANTFDFVYSSLTLHYVKDWTKTLSNVYKVMKPGSYFLFSTHHPIRWGAEVKRGKDKNSFLMGYITDKKKDTAKVYGDYFKTRKISDIWFDEFKISYYHKPIESIIKEILSSGFTITDFIEPKPLAGMKRKKKRAWEAHQKIPMFMIFELQK